MDRPSEVLRIKKYPNRRFYDATRSCHVSLSDLYDLVCRGYEIDITDSTTGQNITNVILTQIILERDAPKLAIFPAAILHLMIRTKEQFLGSAVEEFFRQLLQNQQNAQAQWSRFWRNTLGVDALAASVSPTAVPDWARSFWGAFVRSSRPTAGSEPAPGTVRQDAAEPGEPPPEPASERDAEIDELRRQIAELARRLESMGNAPKA